MLNRIASTGLFWFATLTPAMAEGTKLKDSLAWFLVVLCVFLGMLITLQPVKRIKEIKGRRE